MIDSSLLTKHPGESSTIEPSGPYKIAEGIIFLRPLPFQQGLGLPVVLLLLPIGTHRVAAMMPDHSSRAETQRPAALLQPPADIDIIARNAKLGIEAADRLKAGFTKGHVAAWNVFRLLIGKEDVYGVAWCIGDTIGNKSVARGRNVRTAHPSV